MLFFFLSICYNENKILRIRGTNMRLNNKGFAISSMMYSILLLFLMLLVGVLGLLGSRKIILDKIKNEIITDLTQNQAYSFVFDHQNILLANTSKVSNFTFSLLDGVKIMDQNGNIINASITTESSPAFDSTVNGVYTVKYTALYEGLPIEAERTIEVIDPIVYEFAYTGREQTFEAPVNGVYRTELWGAQGGSSLLDGGTRTLSKTGCASEGYCYGGRGAYTAGNIDLQKNMALYIHVGGQGGTGVENGAAVGGYNGGGTGDNDHNDNEADGGGGGATDIRLVSGLWNDSVGLRSRIMVAGAGGGAHDSYGEQNPGGGLMSTASATSNGATQTSGYAFGIGQNGIMVRQNYPLAGAGGGYYGGYSTDGTDWTSLSTGGSSYISGHIGSVAIASNSTQNPKAGCSDGTSDITCSYHYSGYIFTNTSMKSGAEEMPSHDGTTTMTGNGGDGYAKITALVMENGKLATNLVQNSGFETGSMNGWNYSSNQYTAEFVTEDSVSGNYSLKMTNKLVHKDNQQAYQIITAEVGHVYYGTAYINANVADTARTYTRITFSPGTDWTWLLYSDSTSDSKNIWKKHSLWYSNPSYEALKFRIAIGGNSTNGSTIGDYYSMDNAMVLDLTAIYGAGNEPSKEWCDENIQYFDGVGIVPNY